MENVRHGDGQKVGCTAGHERRVIVRVAAVAVAAAAVVVVVIVIATVPVALLVLDKAVLDVGPQSARQASVPHAPARSIAQARTLLIVSTASMDAMSSAVRRFSGWADRCASMMLARRWSTLADSMSVRHSGHVFVLHTVNDIKQKVSDVCAPLCARTPRSLSSVRLAVDPVGAAGTAERVAARPQNHRRVHDLVADA